MKRPTIAMNVPIRRALACSGLLLLPLVSHAAAETRVAPDAVPPVRLAAPVSDNTPEVNLKRRRVLEKGRPLAMAFTADSRYLMAIEQRAAERRPDNDDYTSNVYRVDRATGAVSTTVLTTTQRLMSVAFASDGSRVAGALEVRDEATRTARLAVKVWNTTTGAEVATWEGTRRWTVTSRNSPFRWSNTGPSVRLAISLDPSLLAVGVGREMTLLSADSGQVLRSWEVVTLGDIDSVSFTRAGKGLIAAYRTGSVEMRDTTTGTLLRTILLSPRSSHRSLAATPDGASLMTVFENQTHEQPLIEVQGWSAAPVAMLWNSGHSASLPAAVQLLDDGKHTLVASLDTEGFSPKAGRLRWYARATGEIVKSVRTARFDVQVALAPDGKTMAESDGLEIKLWDLPALDDSNRSSGS